MWAQNQFLRGGAPAVEDMIADGISKHILVRAYDELSGENPTHGDVFGGVLLAHKMIKKGRPKRGPSRAGPGEERDYSTQMDKTKLEFIRLPVGILGANKGSPIRATFNVNQITVRLRECDDDDAGDIPG